MLPFQAISSSIKSKDDKVGEINCPLDSGMTNEAFPEVFVKRWVKKKKEIPFAEDELEEVLGKSRGWQWHEDDERSHSDVMQEVASGNFGKLPLSLSNYELTCNQVSERTNTSVYILCDVAQNL